MRRYKSHMNGERYLANVHRMEVHDLDNEQVNCQIAEIIAAGHDRPYSIPALARAMGFDSCVYCLGRSKR